MTSPAIILVRPQMGENIGAAARAMANFDLSDLRLVAPRDGWPNPKASDMAGRALNLIDDATVHETTAAAVADCTYILATTARSRAMNLPVLEPREAMAELARRTASGETCAILFGPERTGLENEEVIMANAVVTVPVSETYASLNLAQAVVIMGYEWKMSGQRPAKPVSEEELPAEHSVLEGLFGQLEAALDAVNFWRIPAKKEIMWRNIRAGLTRAGLTRQEIATWRGLIKSLTNPEK